jgi:hypothetical protein
LFFDWDGRRTKDDVDVCLPRENNMNETSHFIELGAVVDEE